MNPRVKAVRVLPNYQLELTFANGEHRMFDAMPYLDTPVFEPLRNPGIFALACVVSGSIEWLGEIDLSYDTLYLESVPVEHVQPTTA